MSIPLCITGSGEVVCAHALAVCADTAAKRCAVCPAIAMADSSHGVGGVCKVVSIGVGNAGAMATGR